MNIVDVSDGRLSLKVPNENDEYSETPCLINGKRVVLPTDAILRAGTLEGMIAFHPLSEHTLRGESEIIKFLRKMIKFRLASVSSQLLIELMCIAADPEQHEDLSPRQAAYLQSVPDANDKTVKALSKLLQTHFDDLFNVYLKRPDDRDNDTFRRVAAVSFPLWDELNTAGSKVYEVECGSVKNKKTIAALFEYVFPNPEGPDEWSVGSNNGVAPYFDSLMKCYLGIGRHLAKLVYKYRKYLDHPDLQRSTLDWEEGLDNLDRWKILIPPLPGNEGALAKGEKEAVPAAPKSRSPGFRPDFQSAANQTTTASPEVVDTPPWEVQPEPAIQPTASAMPPVNLDSGAGLNWRDVMQHRPAPVQGPAYGGAHTQSHTTFQMGSPSNPPQTQWGTPVQQPGHWGQPAQQPTQQPGWQHAPGGQWGGGGGTSL
jgi:hypothetical protein